MAEKQHAGQGSESVTIDRLSLWSWGANNYGQLGTGNKDDLLVPSVVSQLELGDLTEIKDVGGGGGFSYLLTESGQLFTCGNNDKGQLGQNSTEILTVFCPCRCLTDIKIARAAGGWDFMLAITDSGSLLSWGSNSFGQLGRQLKPGVTHDAAPGEVKGEFEGKLTDVKAGLRHAISITDCGKVYTWGDGRKSQLGNGNTGNKGGQSLSGPQRVNIPGEEKPVAAFAGMYHSGILTEAGSVIMWGYNKYGQCGLDPAVCKTQAMPTKITCVGPDNKEVVNIVSVVSGWTHVIARTDSGEVYSWGRGDLGQLGRPCDKSCDHIPVLVPGLPSVKSHSCGSQHNLVLTGEGEVYSWGWNEHGICGTGDEQNVLQPFKIPVFVDKHVAGVACGTGHSFCTVINTYR